MHDVSLIIRRCYVALRKESVDRNMLFLLFRLIAGWSLSARRAWIEILCAGILRPWACVALRKESVDRNINCMTHTQRFCVALRKESVDRNDLPG